MFHPRPCGCKGQRTCLLCEKEFGALNTDSWVLEEEKQQSYVYCPHCNLAWPGWDADSWKVHPDHEGESIQFPGVKVLLNFITEDEETQLMTYIDEVPWDLSQSGRKKQNYGPKCNFKKRKVRTENFKGYPAFTKFIQDRFSSVDILKGFQTVEQCSLDYSVETGASIDPHIDDCWIWGERIPTLSMLSDSVLTLRKFKGPEHKYNLLDTLTYPSVMTEHGTVKEEAEIEQGIKSLIDKNSFKYNKQNVSNDQQQNVLKDGKQNGSKEDTQPGSMNHIQKSSKEGNAVCNLNIVRLPMPRHSLLVFYGPPRYKWEHGILREDIITRRVCITYRELTPTYLSHGPQSEIGKEILKAGKEFWDHVKFYNLTAD